MKLLVKVGFIIALLVLFIMITGIRMDENPLYKKFPNYETIKDVIINNEIYIKSIKSELEKLDNFRNSIKNNNNIIVKFN